MKPPKELEEVREVGLKVDSKEGEMEAEGRANITTAKNKVTYRETSLTQYSHGSLTKGIMGMQLKTARS
jgi:hypothetical protein